VLKDPLIRQLVIESGVIAISTLAMQFVQRQDEIIVLLKEINETLRKNGKNTKFNY
jgi:hypothetical protein